MSRFVRPEQTTLHISNGDWLIVRKRLNTGEQRAMFARMARSTDDYKVNPMHVGLATVSAYLLDWSLTDDDGKRVVIAEQPIDVVEAVLNNLDTDSFKEIEKAIDKHVEALSAERAKEKESPFTESVSSATSPSLDSSAAPMPRSVN